MYDVLAIAALYHLRGRNATISSIAGRLSLIGSFHSPVLQNTLGPAALQPSDALACAGFLFVASLAVAALLRRAFMGA
jgi:hypothetical protein